MLQLLRPPAERLYAVMLCYGMSAAIAGCVKQKRINVSAVPLAP